MKKQMFFSLTMAAIFLFACQPPIVFDKPQPADVAALGGFPARMQGKYLSMEDSTFMEVTAQSMIRTYDFYQKIHISQLGSNQQLIDDTLFDLKTNEGKLIQIEGDSIVEHIKEADTLFTIDELNILKKFKGYYFVNIYAPPDTWQVKKLEISKRQLTLNNISPKEDLKQLKAITGTIQDTVPYIFSPTRQHFRKFVRNEGFRDSEKFVKISE